MGRKSLNMSEMHKFHKFSFIIDLIKRGYLGLCIVDLDELNGCLKKLSGELILERSTVKILSLNGYNRGLLNLKEDQGLPLK